MIPKIAAENGNLVSMVTRATSEQGKRRITIKVVDISADKVQKILEDLNLCVEDIRVI